MALIKRHRRLAALLLCTVFVGVALGASTGGSAADYTVKAPGISVISSGQVKADISEISEGYVSLRYSGDNPKVKLQITKSGGTTYTYDINERSRYEVFSFTEGSGSYAIQVYENVSGTSYSCAFAETVSVKLRDETLPFLYPNQYVNFGPNSNAVKKAEELSQGKTELETVSAIYNYIITNVTYDTAKANSVQSGYLPSVDDTLATGKGICFDYASLMTAMLRSVGIPTRLDIGYVSGGLYHAWISTYIEDTGWVNGLIYFDGTTWKLMDPTFGAGGYSAYTGSGTGYSVKFVY